MGDDDDGVCADDDGDQQAETLKYFFLLFGSEEILPLTEVVFNTEAHVFPKFEMGKLFKTGWERGVPPEPRVKVGGEEGIKTVVVTPSPAEEAKETIVVPGGSDGK
jgi:mannosyl-oligosaccharide alpha-1,2-mannosidase